MHALDCFQSTCKKNMATLSQTKCCYSPGMSHMDYVIAMPMHFARVGDVLLKSVISLINMFTKYFGTEYSHCRTFCYM